MKIDNFALTMFQTCPAKYQLRMVEGWTGKRKSAPLGFGAAFHAGLAAWYRTGSLPAALDAIEEVWPNEHPVDDYRTLEKCKTVMRQYAAEYPTEEFKIIGMPQSPIVEQTFTIDTGMALNCVHCNAAPNEEGLCPNGHGHCEPIEYGGIFDGLVEYGSQVYVFEHKTTSQLGDYYFTQFKPNNQVSGYVWAAGKMSGNRVGGAIINAIGVYKVGATKFKRDITSRSESDINNWLKSVRQSCQMIADARKNKAYPMHTQACTLYGLCEYHSVHVLGSKEHQQKRLEMDYVHEPWIFEDRDE